MRCNKATSPGQRRRAAQAGFTLLELLITMVVMAVLLAIAVPSFLSFVQSQHNTDITGQFAQDVAWAQGEAMAGQTVQITMASDGSWSTTEVTYNSAHGGSLSTAAVPGHSLSSTQLQADAPGVTCTVVGGTSASCAAVMSISSIGIITGAPSGVVEYTTGNTTSSFQLFASGTLVPNPSYAS